MTEEEHPRCDGENRRAVFGQAPPCQSQQTMGRRRSQLVCCCAFLVQNLANTAWAFGAATQTDAMLFAALARAVERRLGAFIAQDLANTA